MSINSEINDGLNFPKVRPDRHWIRYFITYYSTLIGLLTSIVVIASLYLVDKVVMFIALALYWAYWIVRIKYSSNKRWDSLYRSTTVQFIRSLFLVAGVTTLLYFVYNHTHYFEKVKLDTLWLLYILAISVISQRGSRSFLLVILLIVITCLYFVSSTNGTILLDLPKPVTLEFSLKAIWLITISLLTYILLRYMSDTVASLNLIINVQNRMREVEGKFLRTRTELDESNYLEQMVDIIKKDLSYDHVNVFQFYPDKRELQLVAGACDQAKGLVNQGFTINIDQVRSIVAHVAKTSDSYVANNVNKSEHYLLHNAFPFTKSELAVPIWSRNRLYGILDIEAHATNYFLPQDLKAIQILANHIGWVVDNAEQYKHINWVNHLVETVASPIFTQNHLDDTLLEIAKVAQRELGVDLLVLYSYDPQKEGNLDGPIYAGRALRPEFLNQELPDPDDVANRLIIQEEEFFINENLSPNEIKENPLLRPSATHVKIGRPTFIEREEIRSNVIIRLIANSQCVGLLFLNFRKPRTFSIWDQRRYFTLARLAALAIQKMHSQQRLIQVEMADLANRIHDKLGGGTLGLFKVLKSIDLTSKSSDLRKAREGIDLALDVTSMLHNDIRYIHRLLKDTSSDDLQFELDRRTMFFSQVFKVDITIEWKGDPRTIPSQISQELIVVIHEALTNSVRWGKSTKIEILGSVGSQIFEMSIIDNGIGFDINLVRRMNGVLSMRQRVEEMKGTFDITSKPSKGTVISFGIPLYVSTERRP